MRRFFSYIKKLTEANSEESSKRFIALFTMVLVGYLVFRFAHPGNLIAVLGELLGFVLILLGVAVYQSVKNRKEKTDPEDDLHNS